MEIKSTAKFIRNAPDKIRLLVTLVKGKKYADAVSNLQFSNKAAATPLVFTLKQAKDQAKAKGIGEENLIVKSMTVNEGPKLKRRRIRHQGRSTMILKRMSHINIILTDEQVKKMENRKSKIVKTNAKKTQATEGSK